MASEKLIDLFKRLEGTPDLVEKIFDYLPQKSLSRAECVSRSWNTAIREGRFWSRKLKQQVGLDLTCRQVIKQFPADTNQTDSKDIFKRMSQSVLRVDQNWRNGRCKKTEIPLSDIYHQGPHKNSIKDLLTMNDESIAIGSYEKGVITCFNRQSLLTAPHIANHGQPLQYLKFSGEYLLSASSEMVKIWDKQATTTLDTIPGIIYTRDNDCCCFGAGHGLFVCFSSRMKSNSSPVGAVKVSVWRLKSREEGISELVHQETFDSFNNVVATEAYVSETYIVSLFQLNDLLASKFSENFTIQVRLATGNFDVVQTVDGSGMVRWFSFFNKRMLVQVLATGLQDDIKFFDCEEERTFRELPVHQFYRDNPSFFNGSNSKFAICVPTFQTCLLDVNCSIVDVSSVFEGSPSSVFLGAPVYCLKGFDCGESNRSGDLRGFVMDELTVVQCFRTADLGGLVCKLVVLDFYDETRSCHGCNQFSGSLRQCNACSRVFYCSVACQRSDWTRHRPSCSPPVQ